MIDKDAEMTRLAEVRGCVAAFHDAGLIKCASEDAFDDFCEQVASQIGYDYDLQKIAAAADGILSGIRGAFRGDKIRKGREQLATAKLVEHMPFLKKHNQRVQEDAKKLIRKGKIERAVAYGGTGAAGLAGAGGVAYGVNAYMND